MDDSFSHNARQITKWQLALGSGGDSGNQSHGLETHETMTRRMETVSFFFFGFFVRKCATGVKKKKKERKISAWTAARACALAPFRSPLYLQPNAYDAALSQAPSRICSPVR